MPRRLVVLACAAALTTAATTASADTVTRTDPRDRAGAADIRSLTVDNTGSTVGVRVTHQGTAWRGEVRLEIDADGDRAHDYVVTITRDRPGRASFELANGRRWRCGERTAVSRLGSKVTRFGAPRRCLAGAPALKVRAEVRLSRRVRVGDRVETRVARRVVDRATSPMVRQQTRPNVVVIMTDDMRADDIQYMPATRRLIGGQGVTFANSFAPYPLCCPARASLLTGLYTHNHRVYDVMPPYAFTSFRDSSTLPVWLQASGYSTTFVGKYLNGYGWMPEPGQTEGNSLRYVPPGWNDWRGSVDSGIPAGHPKEGGTYLYFDTTLSVNGRLENYAGRYQSAVYGRLSEQIVRERAASDRPFFYYLSFTAPHGGGPIENDDPQPVTRDNGGVSEFPTPARPIHVRGMFDETITAAPGADWDPSRAVGKPDYLADLTNLNDGERAALLSVTRQRAESLYAVDLQVQRLVRALRESGELEETLIVFTSDNGYFLGEQRIRLGKTLPHDPSLRVPLLMRGPGIPAGEVRYDPFMTIDLAPTVAALAKVDSPYPMDGRSMLGVARNGDRGWTRAVLTSTGPKSSVQRSTDDSGNPVAVDDPGARDQRWAIGVRTDRYLYVDLATGEEELYDLAVDPRQYVNLATDPLYADVLAALRLELRRVRACDGDACAAPMATSLRTAPGVSIVAGRRR